MCEQLTYEEEEEEFRISQQKPRYTLKILRRRREYLLDTIEDWDYSRGTDPWRSQAEIVALDNAIAAVMEIRAINLAKKHELAERIGMVDVLNFNESYDLQFAVYPNG